MSSYPSSSNANTSCTGTTSCSSGGGGGDDNNSRGSEGYTRNDGDDINADNDNYYGSLLHICLATGTKCLGNNAPLAFPGCTLADSHAEVLCRRAFNRYLLQSIQEVLKDSTYQLHPHCPVERVEGHAGTCIETETEIETKKEGAFRVKNNWEFWMYISDRCELLHPVCCAVISVAYALRDE